MDSKRCAKPVACFSGTGVQRAMDTQPGLMKALDLPNLSSVSPTVAAWIAAVEALPGVAETFPPHWTEATKGLFN